MLTTRDVITLSGATTMQLRRLCEIGVKPGEGSGYHRSYSAPEIIALVYGIRMTALGFGNVVADKCAQYLASLSEKDLKRAIGEGRTFLFPVPGHFELIAPPIDDLGESKLDIGNIYEELMALKRSLQKQN
jgi:hypothetical protein